MSTRREPGRQVVLEREEVQAERQAVMEEAAATREGTAARERLHGQLEVWDELLERMDRERREERERRREMRKTTREQAMELVRRVRRQPPDSGTATSRAAAEAIKRAETNRETRILALLLMRPYGLTDEQMQQVLGLNPDTQRPGRWLLSDKLGLVEDSGRTRETAAGNPATVWVAWRHAQQQAELALGGTAYDG